MQTNETSGQDSIELEPRTERALSECMSVLPNHGRASGAPGLFYVVGENGGSYLVDTHGSTCECPDSEYNNNHCKHQRRCEILNGERPVPNDALSNIQIDNTFGAHVDTEPIFVTADGGLIDGETGEELSEESSETESGSVWSPPRPELDKHGNPTGCQIVECTSCQVETITSLVEFASHREGCQYQ
jgi:hypothetical protein